MTTDILFNQKATVRALFDALNARDIDGVIAVRTPECLHIVTPGSVLGETRTNDEHRAWMRKTGAMSGRVFFTTTISREIHDADQHEAAVHAHAVSPKTPAGTFKVDFILFVKFTEDGTKMTEVNEVITSNYPAEFHAKMHVLAEKPSASEKAKRPE
ncbi:hypothetical protein LTR97_004023 [Elasticomyces elasticus]|uniref:SnoaL-like domain-containing protein n=1 Tax=Elasticomyces elasticus TaxID=574655 RepID=A0AAN7W9Q4_9PEZI|nr:hypothetical protein LTR97_004023 [Elasticomyces elasticus]